MIKIANNCFDAPFESYVLAILTVAIPDHHKGQISLPFHATKRAAFLYSPESPISENISK